MALVDGLDFEGTTTNILQLNNLEPILNGQVIRCLVNSFCGPELTSNEVMIDVEQPAIANFDFEIDMMNVQFTNQKHRFRKFSMGFW